MVATLVLVLGLAAVFAALAVVVLVVGQAAKERAELRASLASVGEFHITGPRAPQPGILPFQDRVLSPMWQRSVRLGRKITPSDRVATYQRKLEAAGVSEAWDTNRVLAWKFVGLVSGIPAGWAFALLLGLPGFLTLVAAGVGALAGYFGVDIWLYNTALHRQDSIRKVLPDAIDMLTISVEAGLSFDGGLAEVARHTKGPLAQEAFRTLQEMQIGVGRAQALEALGERTRVTEVQAFVASIIQADRYGVPIAQVLRVQSQEMRVRRRQAAEERAQKVPIKIIFPLVACIMPAMFVVLLGPAGMSIFSVLG